MVYVNGAHPFSHSIFKGFQVLQCVSYVYLSRMSARLLDVEFCEKQKMWWGFFMVFISCTKKRVDFNRRKQWHVGDVLWNIFVASWCAVENWEFG